MAHVQQTLIPPPVHLHSLMCLKRSQLRLTSSTPFYLQRMCYTQQSTIERTPVQNTRLTARYPPCPPPPPKFQINSHPQRPVHPQRHPSPRPSLAPSPTKAPWTRGRGARAQTARRTATPQRRPRRAAGRVASRWRGTRRNDTRGVVGGGVGTGGASAPVHLLPRHLGKEEQFVGAPLNRLLDPFAQRPGSQLLHDCTGECDTSRVGGGWGMQAKGEGRECGD